MMQFVHHKLFKNGYPNPSEGMRLRVAVQAIEAWMMADAEHLAAFLSVSSSKDAN